MWLILTEPDDDTGAWLAEGLGAHVAGPVTLLTTRDFAHRAHTVRLIVGGEDWFQVTVDNGASIDSRNLRGVVNRICALPPGLAYRLNDPQRDNAQRNFRLPLLRLLHDFPGNVLNRPTPQGISGDFRLDFEWAALASQAGLPRAPTRASWSETRPPGRIHTAAPDSDTVPVAVIGDQVLALNDEATRLPSHVISQCRRLAALSRTSLLGLDLVRTPDGDWQFMGAHPRINLIPGGADALAAVARALVGSTARTPSGRDQSLAAHSSGATF